jgi:3-oxoacyl-[acyl-carrier-protein] synthase-3
MARRVCLVRARPGPIVVSEAEFGSDPSGAAKVGIHNGGHLRQDGPAVQSFAIKRSVALVRDIRRDHELFVGHQANLRMLQAVCEHAAIPCHRHLWNVDARGNCGAAASVISSAGTRCAAASTAVVVQVGAGLSWGTLPHVLRWRLEQVGEARMSRAM